MNLLRILAISFCCTATLLSSCAEQKNTTSTSGEQASLRTATLQIGSQQVTVECAVTQEEKSRGLMFRKSLPKNSGMLFYFDKPQQVGFWMKNTLIPLSIAFLNENGKILEIYPMTPLDKNSTPSRSYLVKYALEMNQGWFKENEINPGDVVKNIPKLQE